MAKPGRIYLGTAGWSVPREWAASVTPEGSGLARYASALGAAEINSTFYRRHRASTFERWRDTVPEAFRFAVKVPRSITHDAELGAPKKPLAIFLGDIAGLGPKLGPLLVQLPASMPFVARRATAFFRALRALHPGPVVCEPRHASWYAPAVTSLFVAYDVARVVADPPRPAAASEPAGTTSLVYYRLHGSPRRYWSAYDDAYLEALATRILAQATHATVWCMFDNTASGAALGNALGLTRLTTRSEPPA